MRLLSFSSRNAKEILRDPLTLFFGLGFPVILLLLLSAIQANIPVSLFEIKNLAPGITVFGLSFMTLFSATLIAKDRESAFLQRLLTTPLTASEFILGYALPIIPISVAQGVICYITALFLGLDFSVNIIYAVLLLAVISLFYIFLGYIICKLVYKRKKGGIYLEDKELIYTIQHGNKELLEILIEKYYDDIYRFCYYKTGNSSLSYDLTQEIFLKLIKYIGTYKHRGKFKSYFKLKRRF